ncbi:hypothetical protein [Afifella sp. YEN Y35]|uniref:hypothetical protein n=1 Tax=Afifella sp. YEN Y35 TaxID=3388337 RepID=UPI0039E191E8
MAALRQDIEAIPASEPTPFNPTLGKPRAEALPPAVETGQRASPDIAGPTAYGFRTVWINRSGQADEYHALPAAAVLPDLKALLRV